MEALALWGLDVIVAVQQIRGPVPDAVFRAISLLGEEGFYIFLLPVLFWVVDFGLAARLASLFLLSSAINADLKDLFAQPRPFDLNPAVQVVSASGYGIPSGHAQSAVVIFGLLAAWLRKTWFWLAAVGLMALIGFSRVYLGAHFPTDVLAGWLIGAILLALSLAAQDSLERWLTALGFHRQVLLAFAVPFALFLAHPVEDTASVLGALAGIGVGVAVTRRHITFPSRPDWWQTGLRFASAGLIALALYLGLKLAFPDESSDLYLAFRFLRYGLTGAWLSLGAPWLFQWLPPARRVEARS